MVLRDEAFLAHLDAITRNLVVPAYIESSLFGAFTLLIIVSTYILLRWGVSTRGGWIMFALIIIMYIMSAAQWALHISLVWLELSVLLPGVLAPGGQAIIKAQGVLGPLVAMSAIPSTINIILSDSIVVWRMCAIWLKNRIVVGIAMFMILCTSTLFVIFAVVQVVPEMGQQVPKGISGFVGPAAFIASLTTNIWATGMVGYKVWRNHRFIKIELQGGSRRTAVESILVLLIESGAVYCVISPTFLPRYTLSNLAQWGLIYRLPWISW